MVQKSEAESCKNRNTKFFVSNRLRETIIETSRRAGITEWPCQSVFLLERNALLYHFRTIAHKPPTFASALESGYTHSPSLTRLRTAATRTNKGYFRVRLPRSVYDLAMLLLLRSAREAFCTRKVKVVSLSSVRSVRSPNPVRAGVRRAYSLFSAAMRALLSAR